MNITRTKDGYFEVMSDKGIHYSLLEGITIGGKRIYSSDILFIMIDDYDRYDSILEENNIERIVFVGFMYGAGLLVDASDPLFIRNAWENVFDTIQDWENNHSEIVELLKEDEKVVEPIKITDKMREMKQKEIDQAVEEVNKKIEEAVERGWTDTSFDVLDEYFDEVKAKFVAAGYKISVNPYARQMYTCYKISW